VHFRRVGLGVDLWEDLTVVAAAAGRSVSWDGAETLIAGNEPTLRKRPVAGASYAELPGFAGRADAYQKGVKKLKTFLYRSHRLRLFSYPEGKLTSEPGETQSDFRRRVQLERAEQRDLEVEKLRTAFAKKVTALEKRMATAEERVDREKSQLRDRKLQTAISFGTSLLGAVLGRKKLTAATRSSAARALRDVGRSRREGDDVSRAEERLSDLLKEKQSLESDFEQAAAELKQSFPASEIKLETVEVPMLKTDLTVKRTVLVWLPWGIDRDGIARKLA